ncbi:MAG: TolC family protein [Sneathiellaceae bacterium]
MAEPADSLALRAEIATAVDSHDRVLGAAADLDAAQQRARVALGGWYPTVDFTGKVGRARVDEPASTATTLNARGVTLTVSQLLWDFGARDADIERARLQLGQSESALKRTRQEVLGEALSAYVNLVRSADVLAFASQSVENIRRQTGLEEVRIQVGAGYTTDLLQAKTQLAGAEARRVAAIGEQEEARNRYRAVFGSEPAATEALFGVGIREASLPATLQDALDIAFISNPQVREAALQVAVAQQDRRILRSDELFPRLELKGESKMEEDVNGTAGYRGEQSLRLEMNFGLNLGLTALNRLRAAQADIVSTSRALADLRRSIEESVRNSWQRLDTAELRSRLLFDQAEIARAFLDVAVQERALGQRSLIDVLSGETALINAQSDAVAAEAEVVLASVALLAATGQLRFEDVVARERLERTILLARDPPSAEQLLQLQLPGANETAAQILGPDDGGPRAPAGIAPPLPRPRPGVIGGPQSRATAAPQSASGDAAGRNPVIDWARQ